MVKKNKNSSDSGAVPKAKEKGKGAQSRSALDMSDPASGATIPEGATLAKDSAPGSSKSAAEPLLEQKLPNISSKAGSRKRTATTVEETPKEKILKPTARLPRAGILLTLGENDVGQLGLGPDVSDRSHPTVVAGIPEPVAVAVAGGMHTACITITGKVYTFGCNDEGALGRPTAENDAETTPGEVNLLEQAVQVSAGDSHTAVLTELGRVYAWGTFRDANGSMGLRSGGPEKNPVILHCPGDKKVVKIASGCDHLVCLTCDGAVYTIGCAEQGQLGRVAECFAKRDSRKGQSNLLTLQEVHFRMTRKHRRPIIEDVWAGTYVTFCKAKDSGDIYAWGLNNYYQLGLPDMVNRFVPELVTAFANERNWQDFAGGQHHTVAVDSSGAVFSVGRGTYGQLGLGTTSDASVPARIESLASQHCNRVAASSSVSFAVTKTGNAFAWGMNTSKQLGGADEDDVLEPREMHGKQIDGKEIMSISSGGQHTVILACDSTTSTR